MARTWSMLIPVRAGRCPPPPGFLAPRGGAYRRALLRSLAASSSAAMSIAASAAFSMRFSVHALGSTPWRARLPSHAFHDSAIESQMRRTT